MSNVKHRMDIIQTKQDACKRIAEFIDYVKVQHEVKSANPNRKGKILYFNRKGINANNL